MSIRKEFGIKITKSLNDLFQTTFKLHKESGIYSAIFSEAICVVSKYPKKVHRNEEHNLHNTHGAAVEWGFYSPETNFECHFINGRSMPKRIFEDFTKEDFLAEENEDIKAGMYEIIESNGEGSMLDFLGAEKVHTKTFIHANGELEEMELYRTANLFHEEEDLNGRTPAPLAWLKMSCPSTNQTYLIPTDSSFDDCESAAKFHRPNYVTQDVPYSWEQRN